MDKQLVFLISLFIVALFAAVTIDTEKKSQHTDDTACLSRDRLPAKSIEIAGASDDGYRKVYSH